MQKIRPLTFGSPQALYKLDLLGVVIVAVQGSLIGPTNLYKSFPRKLNCRLLKSELPK